MHTVFVMSLKFECLETQKHTLIVGGKNTKHDKNDYIIVYEISHPQKSMCYPHVTMLAYIQKWKPRNKLASSK